jgi:Family of unknown function (DUF6353)
MIFTFLKRVEKLTVDNSPVLLTGVGVIGTIATAVLAGRASFKAAQLIYEERINDSYPDAPGDVVFSKEDVKQVWTLYLPAIGSGVITVASIVASNRIGTRRAVALAAAYSVSERAFADYREKVVERLGQGKEQAVRDEIAQDRVDRASSSQVVIGTGKVLCFESITGRYFESDMESLRKAQNDLNQMILHHSYATLSDFYELIGLPSTTYSMEIGWNTSELCELKFSTCLAEDGRPCISVEYSAYPIRDYY